MVECLLIYFCKPVTLFTRSITGTLTHLTVSMIGHIAGYEPFMAWKSLYFVCQRFVLCQYYFKYFTNVVKFITIKDRFTSQDVFTIWIYLILCIIFCWSWGVAVHCHIHVVIIIPQEKNLHCYFAYSLLC